jgi:hypothetical protein
LNDDAYTKITKIFKNDNWVDIKPIINNTDKIEKSWVGVLIKL